MTRRSNPFKFEIKDDEFHGQSASSGDYSGFFTSDDMERAIPYAQMKGGPKDKPFPGVEGDAFHLRARLGAADYNRRT